MRARMRRLSVSVDSAMTDHPEESRSADGPESSFHERVKKLLSSPLSRRKSASCAASSSSRDGSKLKVFGSPLSTLAHAEHPPTSLSLPCSKEPGIPYVITRLCHYIETESGLNQEGLFRISANVKLVERLKQCFDESGDAPLEDSGDVAAAAALLKLFLRELPQPVIPSHMNQPFFAAVRDFSLGLNDGKERLRALVAVLPNENFFILKYLCAFLHRVSLNEEWNRMNSSSLGIVFGPNIFRVSPEDYKEYRDQAISGPNQIVSLFISESGYMFDEDLRKTSGVLKKIWNMDTVEASQRKGKVKRRGASEGEAESFCQQLNSHIIPILILNNEALSASVRPNMGSASARKRRESKLLGADTLPFCRSSSEERPSSFDDSLTPLPGDIRRCISSDEMSFGSSEFSRLTDTKHTHIVSFASQHAERPDCISQCPQHDMDVIVLQDSERRGSFLESKRMASIDEDLFSPCEPFNSGPPKLTFEAEKKRKNVETPLLGVELVPREHRNSWPRDRKDSQKMVVKSSYINLASCPLTQSSIFRELSSSEASISPSACRSYLNQRSRRLSDPNVAPSPPQDQEFLSSSRPSLAMTSFHATVLKDTRMRMQSLKEKLRAFEQDFEHKQGRKARFEDKVGSNVAQPILQELLTLRRSLREFKEDFRQTDIEQDSSPKPNLQSGSERERLAVTFEVVQKDLECRRSVAGRPVALEGMSPAQMMEEKIDLQKTLLKFESVHGRPTSKTDRDVMRPLYDRYRAVKRLISRMPATEVDLAPCDLAPILEHVVMSFPTQQSCQLKNEPSAGGADAVMKGTDTGEDCDTLELEKASHPPDQNLHELPLVELVRLLKQSRCEKRRLRRLIKTFEEEFIKSTGRKAEKGDRGDVAKVYSCYKNAKGKLRLLEALVTKTDKSHLP